jgi:hypothetical protein
MREFYVFSSRLDKQQKLCQIVKLLILSILIGFGDFKIML